jgi:hypothetical protein
VDTQCLHGQQLLVPLVEVEVVEAMVLLVEINQVVMVVMELLTQSRHLLSQELVEVEVVVVIGQVLLRPLETQVQVVEVVAEAKQEINQLLVQQILVVEEALVVGQVLNRLLLLQKHMGLLVVKVS